MRKRKDMKGMGDLITLVAPHYPSSSHQHLYRAAVAASFWEGRGQYLSHGNVFMLELEVGSPTPTTTCLRERIDFRVF